ncbi:D-alanyl-D-alanine carboxypeptidase DacC [Serratia plymuthica]|jgi:D-alanyl-D-alanine carboxypeptidase (penicillin-binding protein 5/6)|uniref:serine-type D-Ala-D-Ala carboxypeptidase n=2 Tax=Serratia plymuthica TaxID=82996 RepID=A0A2X4U8F5_SERPL|nr:serine hydrolase [Serratia plymuthica]AGP43805.1 D-alanyl-D-alanine carboxypeptidase [Serratia plymuthica S13]ANJ91952.1 D-alanyl-D-alanine carboxypeptidase [Serratia plymuthica]KYG15466.1 D-alanyl-D-alanine carboxypeptidase DacC precursor [Serratia plymuthica]MBI6137415.1 serine hydrolase [Serratia plymuthica]NIC25186.1 serine-type D-Ala-D-Ala carboxypeptidase [Serratia plymuthica]
MMKKNLSTSLKKLTFSVSILLLATPAIQAAEAPAAPQVDAKAFVLMDYNSGKILTEGNADTRLDPASLTKIMSSYVIGQAIKAGKIKPEDMVTVGKDAWATGNPALRGSSLMFIKPGDQVPVMELNKGIVIQSGNDASIALADYVAGSQDSFVGLMNNYAKSLGLQNTHFLTVHGLDAEGQYSTARDMALLSQALIRDVPDEYALHKEKEFTFNKIRQVNRNRLLWSSNLNVDGIKTGYTGGAGHNLVASATDGPMRLISVVLGAPSDRIRFSESEKLLTWGFRFYETATPIKTDKPFVTQRVWFGEINDVPLGVAKDAAVTIPKGQMKNLKASYKLNQPTLEAPLAKNQVVGTIDFQLDGKTIEQYPLVVMQEVKEGNFFSRIWDMVMMKLSQWFGSVFG